MRRSDERLGLASGKSLESDWGTLQEGISGTSPRKEGQLSSHEVVEATGVLSDHILTALIADASSRFASTRSCLAGNNTDLQI